MSFPSYNRYVDSGEMTQAQADAANAARDHGQISARSIPIGDHPPETVFMGVLDVVVGTLARVYGPRDAAAIMRHYGDVCERNTKREGRT